MTQPITVSIPPERRAAAARSRAYGIFSRIFRYPSDNVVQPMLDGSLREELRQALDDLPYPSSLVAQVWPPLPDCAEDLQASYCGLFDTSRPRGAAVSLSEKDYVQTERSLMWEDLLRFYEHFGLEYSIDKVPELPDHLVTELDFLHYLAFLEAATVGDDEPFGRAREDFVGRHLGKWLPALADKIARAGADTPYAAFGAMLQTFLADEVKAMSRTTGEYA